MWPRKLGGPKCMVHRCWDYEILRSVSHTYIQVSLPVNENVLIQRLGSRPGSTHKSVVSFGSIRSKVFINLTVGQYSIGYNSWHSYK